MCALDAGVRQHSILLDNCIRASLASLLSVAPLASAEPAREGADSFGVVAPEASVPMSTRRLKESIRRQLLQRNDLSDRAKSVRIRGGDGGGIAISGSVQTAAERDLVLQIARSQAGQSAVTSELKVDRDG